MPLGEGVELIVIGALEAEKRFVKRYPARL